MHLTLKQKEASQKRIQFVHSWATQTSRDLHLSQRKRVCFITQIIAAVLYINWTTENNCFRSIASFFVNCATIYSYFLYSVMFLCYVVFSTKLNTRSTCTLWFMFTMSMCILMFIFLFRTELNLRIRKKLTVIQKKNIKPTKQ